MSKENIQQVTYSFPVFSALSAVLIVLKLLGKISISWLWALAPIWIPFGLGIVVIALVLLVVFGVAFIGALKS